MNEIKTEIIIDASIDKIWNVLLDFASYPDWNPFIRKLQGNPVVGSKLSVIIQSDEKKPMTFYPTVLTVGDYHLAWLGSLFIRGLFDGQHNFKLIPLNNSSAKLLHYEHFSGILSKPILMFIQKSTLLGFEKMNQALKNRCELNRSS